MKVYLIEKASGSYDDYYSYVDNGFFDKTKAEEYVEKYNSQLTANEEQSRICNECACGKYRYKSQIIRNCKRGAKLSDLVGLERVADGVEWYHDCKLELTGYDDEHPARIKEIEVE